MLQLILLSFRKCNSDNIEAYSRGGMPAPFQEHFGRALQVTQIAAGDAIAAGAVLAMGEADEGRPLVVVRGLPREWFKEEIPAPRLGRTQGEDLFR